MNTKAYISSVISHELNIKNIESQKLFSFFLELIKENAKSKSVKLSKFGTFFTHNSPKRVGRNPKTKESYIIKPMKKLSFKASTTTKNKLN